MDLEESNDEDMRISAAFTLGRIGRAAKKLRLHEGQVRKRAVFTLGKSDPAALAQLAHTVVARLEDSDFSARSRAVEAVAKLEPAARDKFAGALVARLAEGDASNGDFRWWALDALGKLSPLTLARYTRAVVVMLDDAAWPVRKAALGIIGSLERAALAQGWRWEPRVNIALCARRARIVRAAGSRGMRARPLTSRRRRPC